MTAGQRRRITWLAAGAGLLLIPALLVQTERPVLAVSVGVFVMLLPRIVPWFGAFFRFWGSMRGRRVALVALCAAAVSLVLLVRIARLDLRYGEARAMPGKTAETSYLPPPIVLKMLSLGHEPLASDLLFLQAHDYFIEHLFADRRYEWLDLYANTMIELDPYNRRVYEWATQTPKFGQMITPEALEKSNDYARRGIERFPDNWRFYFDIGFNYLNEWPSKTQDEADRMRKKALPYLSVAAALPGSELDPNFVASLYLSDDQTEVALLHLYMRYWEANEAQREAIRARIVRYGSKAAAERLERLEKGWKAEFPYLPPGLYAELGGNAPRDGIVPRSWAREGLAP